MALPDTAGEILVVEDDRLQATLLKRLLERHGHAVRLATNGDEALGCLRERLPDLVLSDIVMPVMDGYELCRRIKAESAWHQLPVILVTALTDAQNILFGLECGADNFISKPFDREQLLARIRDMLESRRLAGEPPRAGNVEVVYGGQRLQLSSDRVQILNLLLSSFDSAIRQNRELLKTKRELEELTATLEKKAEDRAKILSEEIAQRRLKDRFLSHVSHELRTPVAAVYQFLSLLLEDCIASGKDYNAGGARYNTTYIQGVGLGSITDILTSVRFNIYDRRRFSWDEMLTALHNNFEGAEEMQYELIYHTPKYGNDDDYADAQAVAVFEMFHDAVTGRPTPRGGIHRINMLPTTSHVYFGNVTGATPDGRKASVPLSEGISPFQGVDSQGPTAVLKSASKIDHLRTGGTLLNQKFSPEFFEDEGSYQKLTALIRSYFSLNGHHIQFNVVSADTLRNAQKHPEQYRDLIVRVAGYSDYFNDLGEDLQNEIIRRTEHGDY